MLIIDLFTGMGFVRPAYFHKSPAWFNQRLNGNIVNGKKAKFSEEELKILSGALQEIAEQLKTVSLVLSDFRLMELGR